ncbi:MAG TPA: RluA family pseudouridine synthase [Devosiaceae bacterium]|nr:RluA family pseudouridine synthase [Devosiaceae bacterium]
MSEPSGAEQSVVFEAGEDDAGQRLDVLLAACIEQLSRSRGHVLILQGAVTVGGETIVEPDYRVKPGHRIVVTIPEPDDPVPRPEPIPLVVLYEDDAVIVIDKPAGLVVHPAPGHRTGTLVNALLHHCGETLTGIGGVRRPGIVHRLDKDTSGVMVAAKTGAALAGLAAQFADHGRTGPLEREYLALVWGAPSPATGTIDAPLGRAPHNRLKQAVLKTGGRRAVTRYRVGEALGQPAGAVSMLACRLETGRTHQIRVHMVHIGHPLLGDPLYGAGFASRAATLSAAGRSAVDALGRQALHAAGLVFAHPVSGEIMRFGSAPPPDLSALIDALRA